MHPNHHTSFPLLFLILHFANRLTSLRTQKGVSAREMSLAIGQNTSYINRIENKLTFPSMQTFFYICDYLNVTPQDFFNLQSSDPCKSHNIMNDINKLTQTQLDAIETVIQEFLRKK